MPFNLEKFWYISFLICVHFVFAIIKKPFLFIPYQVEIGIKRQVKLPFSAFHHFFIILLTELPCNDYICKFYASIYLTEYLCTNILTD